MIVSASTSCCAALVAKPLRRLWPAKLAGLNPASAAYFFTISATDLSVSCESRSEWLRVNGLKRGPVWMSAACSHACTARTAQTSGSGAYGTAISVPRPSWSLFDCGTRMTSPCEVNVRCSTCIATSSERRNAPAKPRKISARSRKETMSSPKQSAST